MFSVADTTIFLTLAGSQAHGTAREGSDVDLRGVCIAPLSVRLSLYDDFEQYEGALEGALAELALPRLEAHPTASRGLGVKAECTVFDIAKFVRLCAAANPNALEILFADPDDWIVEREPWSVLWDERHMFVTRKIRQTFLGYAMAQLKRIRRHRAWLLHPPKKKPSRADFGLAKKRYRAAMREWHSYEAWKRNRNPARAELEKKYGYDTKRAMHLIRLMRTGLEALQTGEIHVRREDAAELNAIRDGAFTFDELLEQAELLRAQLEDAAQESTLPDDVDHAVVDELALRLMQAELPSR